MGRVKHLNDVEGDNSIEVWEMDEYDNNKHMPTLNPLIPIKANQNTCGALLEYPMRTALHGTARVSSAISVCDNYQSFTAILSLEAIAR